ncbi:MAG: diguanylate cyclase, partial [Mariprofundaceae bacterium]|nr:diguanylate cyclase [Mariprofundaceae bacterium]
EEFLVLLPHTSEDNATQAVEKWLKDLKSKAVELLDGTYLNISFSAGVASLPKRSGNQHYHDVNECVDAFLELVDQRLYQAKDQGRSRVVGGR